MIPLDNAWLESASFEKSLLWRYSLFDFILFVDYD